MLKTAIPVRNLFYNVPARKKFLKTPMTEGSYVTELITRLSLSHPEVSFKYIINGSNKIATSGMADKSSRYFILVDSLTVIGNPDQ